MHSTTQQVGNEKQKNVGVSDSFIEGTKENHEEVGSVLSNGEAKHLVQTSQ